MLFVVFLKKTTFAPQKETRFVYSDFLVANLSTRKVNFSATRRFPGEGMENAHDRGCYQAVA